MYIAFFDDKVVQTLEGSVVWSCISEAVDEVVENQENIGHHRDTIDWDDFVVYQRYIKPVIRSEYQHLIPKKVRPVAGVTKYIVHLTTYPSLDDPDYYY